MASHSNGAPKGDGKAEPVFRCVACGERGGGLKQCAACKSVHYCNVDCQRGHREVHKTACKQRAAELAALRDLENYVAPPTEDCPLCMLTLPLAPWEMSYKSCCGKIICSGCSLASARVVLQKEGGATTEDAMRCAFCRVPGPASTQDIIARLTARVDTKNDPTAMVVLADFYWTGDGVPKDENKAFSLCDRAADQGDLDGAAFLHKCYSEGISVKRDESKAIKFLKQAADGGRVLSRYNLGALEFKQGNHKAAMLHFRIAAAAGDETSLEAIKEHYKGGHVSKDELAGSLRGFQAAQDEMKSEAREKFRLNRFKLIAKSERMSDLS